MSRFYPMPRDVFRDTWPTVHVRGGFVHDDIVQKWAEERGIGDHSMWDCAGAMNQWAWEWTRFRFRHEEDALAFVLRFGYVVKTENMGNH